MASALKPFFKHVLITALALSVVITFVPLIAGAMTVD